MSSVGSSIVRGGSWSGLSSSQIVSPISASSSPTMQQTSPALISSTSRLASRSNSRTLTTVSWNVVESFWRTTVTRWFFLMLPRKTRPMQILPTNSE